MVKDIIGDELGIDIDDDGNVEIKDDDGNVVFGNAEWEKDTMHGIKAPKAKLEGSIISDDGAVYTFAEMSEKDAKAYIEIIKDEGFIYNTFEMDETNFTGVNEEGLIISFYFDKETGTGSVISSKGEIPSSDSINSGTVFDTEGVKWDSSIVGGIPDPGTTITSFSTEYGAVYYSFENLDDYEQYVDEIKDCGFTVDESEVVLDDFYMYTAYNNEGDDITFAVSDTGSALNYSNKE
jgi:hypothetical protein